MEKRTSYIFFAMLLIGALAFNIYRISVNKLVATGELGTPSRAERYSVKSKLIIQDDGKVSLQSATNFPEGTFYRLSVYRDMHEAGEVGMMSPNAGAFIPDVSFELVQGTLAPTGVSFSAQGVPFGRVTHGMIRGQIEFFPAKTQLMGCKPPKCFPDPKLEIHIRVDRDIKIASTSETLLQPKDIQWEPGDSPEFSFTEKLPFLFR